MAHSAVDWGAIAQAKFLGDILIQQVAYATSTIGSVKGLPDCRRVLDTIHSIVTLVESTASTTIDSRRELAKDLVFKNIILQLLQLSNKLSAAQDVKRVFFDPSQPEVPLCTAVGAFLKVFYHCLEALDGTCDCCNPGTVIFKKLHRQLAPALLPFARQLATTVDATATELLTLPPTTHTIDAALTILSGGLSALTFCIHMGSSPQDSHTFNALHTQLAKEHALDRTCRLFTTLSPHFQSCSPGAAANLPSIRACMQTCLAQFLGMLFPSTTPSLFCNTFAHPLLLSPVTIEAIKPLMLKDPHILLQLLHHITHHLRPAPPARNPARPSTTSLAALYSEGVGPLPITPTSHTLAHTLIVQAGMWLGSYPRLSQAPLYQQSAQAAWPLLADLLWCCQAPRTVAELQRAEALVALLAVLPLAELASAEGGEEQQRSMQRIAAGAVALLNHLTQYILQVNERLQGPQPLGRSWLKARGWQQLQERADLALGAADLCLVVLHELAVGEGEAADGTLWVEELVASGGFPGQVQRLLGTVCPHFMLLADDSSPGSLAVLAMAGLSPEGAANIVPQCRIDSEHVTQASMFLPDGAYIGFARMSLSAFSAAMKATAAALPPGPCPLHPATKRCREGDAGGDCGASPAAAAAGGEGSCTCKPTRPGGIYPMAPALLVGARAMACMKAAGVGPQEQPPTAVLQAATCAARGLMHVLLLPFWAHTEGSIAKAAEVVLRKCMPPDTMLASLAQMLRGSLLAWGGATGPPAGPAVSVAWGVQ